MMNLEIVGIAILVAFLGLVYWTFLKATSEQRVQVLGMIFPVVGVVVGWLFQEGRVQDKEEQVQEKEQQVDTARIEAAHALSAYADANQRLDDVQRLLREQEPVPGEGTVLPENSLQQLEVLLENRPRFEASLAEERRRSLSEIEARRGVEQPRPDTGP